MKKGVMVSGLVQDETKDNGEVHLFYTIMAANPKSQRNMQMVTEAGNSRTPEARAEVLGGHLAVRPFVSEKPSRPPVSLLLRAEPLTTQARIGGIGDWPAISRTRRPKDGAKPTRRQLLSTCKQNTKLSSCDSQDSVVCLTAFVVLLFDAIVTITPRLDVLCYILLSRTYEEESLRKHRKQVCNQRGDVASSCEPSRLRRRQQVPGE